MRMCSTFELSYPQSRTTTTIELSQPHEHPVLGPPWLVEKDHSSFLLDQDEFSYFWVLIDSLGDSALQLLYISS